MIPENRSLQHRAGQFAFVSFSELGMSEPHPFTLSAAPQSDGRLRMSIGPLGDYTIRLMSRLEVGAKARVEGPFGDFGLARGPQVWVAAGIGITPFAAMANAIKDEVGPITLFYSVRHRRNAAHLEELEAVADRHPNFELQVRETSIEGRLDADVITEHVDNFKGKHLMYCGPAALRKSLWEGLRGRGLSARRFHYELFEIRTGIGLNYLFNYILTRTTKKTVKI